MLIVQNCILSEDIAECCFSCDLACCKGACCVEGDCGAPLLESEIPVLQSLLPQIKPYMCEEGIAVVEAQGVSALDNADEPCTPLINNRECAYLVYESDGTALCAIEKAYRDGKIDFMKPVSCHLYPIRIDDFGEFIAVNYHKWDICKEAVAKGKSEGVPLFRYLEKPLIRRFGQAWYNELVEQCESYLESKKH